MNDAVPRVVTERLILTIPGSAAAERVLTYNKRNREHLARWDPPWTARNFDVDAISAALQRDVQLAAEGKAYRFLIFEGADGVAGSVAGRVTFNEIVRGAFQACYMGYSLALDRQGRGYMTEAARGAIAYMFETVRLHRIMANYIPENERSAAVLCRLGFIVEGTAQNYLYIAGAWRDHVLTSLTNPQPITPEF